MLMRLIFAIAIVIAGPTMVPLSPAQADQFVEERVDRPGFDYRDFDIPKPSGGLVSEAGICQLNCEKDGQCKAWTFVKPGVQGPQARCWLKNAIPEAVSSDCCTSGVPQRTFETQVDRPGNDYRDMDIAGDAQACQRTCQDDRQCMAWTFVKAGVQGSSPRCWLKGGVPDAVSNDCCTSGVADRFVQPR